MGLEEQINQKTKELQELREKLKKKQLEFYSKLIGKYFKVSVSQIVKVLLMDYVDEEIIYFETISITGGENSNFKIEDPYIIGINPTSVTEISEDEFIQTLNNWFLHAKKNLKVKYGL